MQSMMTTWLGLLNAVHKIYKVIHWVSKLNDIIQSIEKYTKVLQAVVAALEVRGNPAAVLMNAFAQVFQGEFEGGGGFERFIQSFG